MTAMSASTRTTVVPPSISRANDGTGTGSRSRSSTAVAVAVASYHAHVVLQAYI